MIAQGALPRPAALYLPSRPAARPATSARWQAIPRWQAIAILAARHRNVAFPLALAASVLAGALATSVIMDCRDSKPETAALEPVHNETVVQRAARPPLAKAEQRYSEHPYTEQVEASDELEDDSIPSNFPRAVQTVRFVNPTPPADIGTVAAAARASIRQALVKVHGFVAFAPKEGAGVDANKGSVRKRTGSIMDQVDDYLWEVYQRVPTKKDGTGDFTWKDPAAAKHMGLALQDYVIGGMDPEFREQLYAAGRAMDAAGLQWSMLSAFRDDYRQGLASGYKASVGNSLHGGSRRTGGYGHGRAIDITGPEGRESEVWNWIDAHGAKYGLHRPLPGNDPAHIQQRGDGHKIALALRESRTGVAATGDKAKVKKTAVAAAR
jgi:hypothetical protein